MPPVWPSVVDNTSGNAYSRNFPSCSELSITYSNVPSGSYTVTAQMLDASGNPVSNFVGPIGVSFSSGDTATPNINFPATAFSNDPAEGTLTLSWTIASSPAAAQCAAHGAVNLSVELFDPNGNRVRPGDARRCSAQSVTIPNLAPGTYTVSAEMVNVGGQPVSSAVSAANVDISAGNTTSQSIHFPIGSFTN